MWVRWTYSAKTAWFEHGRERCGYERPGQAVSGPLHAAATLSERHARVNGCRRRTFQRSTTVPQHPPGSPAFAKIPADLERRSFVGDGLSYSRSRYAGPHPSCLQLQRRRRPLARAHIVNGFTFVHWHVAPLRRLVLQVVSVAVAWLAGTACGPCTDIESMTF